MTNKQLKISAQIGGNWWSLDGVFKSQKLIGIYLDSLKKAIGISPSGNIYITDNNFRAVSNAIYVDDISLASSLQEASELFRKDLKLRNFI